MIKTSNFTSKDNPQWPFGEPARPAQPPRPPQPGAAAGDATGACPGRSRQILVIGGRVALSWLAAVPRRLGDRLFAINDTEAFWRGWQLTKTWGGLGRSYRDPCFGTLAECPKCRGAGVTANLPCPPCLGTGRVTRGEVS